jgi:hypothetical protein
VAGDAGALPRGVETIENRLALQIRVDAAHVVVRAGPHRNRLVDRVDPGEGHRELPRPVESLEDPLGAQVAEVEQHVPVDAAPLVDLGLLGAGDDVAARQLHRVRRVPLQKALALGVEQVGTLTTAPLRDEDTRRREGRRVELHHLHVLQRHAHA